MAKGLSRETLISTALSIVDRDGLSALSMRKLGAELGVDPMAAYRHLPNKEALLDGVVEAVIKEMDLNVDPALSWQDRIRQLISENLRVLLAHPNVLPLIAQRPLITPDALDLVEKALEIMDGAGMPRHAALLSINVMGMMTTSFAVAASASAQDSRTAEDLQALFLSLPRDRFPLITDSMERGEFIESYDQLFEFWTESLLKRLESERLGSN